MTATAAELNILDGVTATAAEINLLDGVTWTLTDYNTLTATAAELNVMGGITGIASQAEAEAGTATDKLMTPERTSQAITALAPASGLGQGQTWQNMTSSRSTGTTYTNNTGKPIALNIETTYIGGGRVGISATIDGYTFEFANAIFPSGGSLNTTGTTIVPDGSTYSISISGGVGLAKWSELR